MQKTRLLIVVSTLGMGGAEKQLVRLLRHFDREALEVRVVSFSRQAGEHWEATVADLVQYARIGKESLRHLRRTGLLWRTMRSFRPHVVWAWHFPVGVYVYPMSRLCGAVYAQGLRSDAKYLLREFPWAGRLLRRCDAAIANTQNVFREFEKFGVRFRQEYYLPNSLDMPDEPVSLSKDVRRIGFCGVLSNHYLKGIDIFLAAATILRENGYTGRFELAGRDPAPWIREQLAHSGLDQVVDMPGKVDCARHVRTFDIFVQSSRNEGCPNTLLEAMANGLPCVATNVGGVSEVIENGVNGLLVTPENPEQLAASLQCLLEKQEVRDTLGRNAREWVGDKLQTDYIGHELFTRIVVTLAGKARGD